jgi:4-diphosphocytidyl-2-C-methyl-D-erythritol kinase
MEDIKIKARAKINVALEVTGKRGDGYHELRTVMQTLALHDLVYVKKVRKKDYLKLVCDKAWLPTDGKNIAYRAAEYMAENFNLDTGLYIELHKNIPVAAGLAGGSSDAAAVLVAIRNLFGLPLDIRDLAEIGARFGADVPFCVHRGTMLALGIGDGLTRLPTFPTCHVLLAKPPFSVSTQEVFASFPVDGFADQSGGKDFDMLVKYIGDMDLRGVCSLMSNALERVTAAKHPIITELKEAMKDNGALGSLMSGSGPTVFGIFEDVTALNKTTDYIRENFPEVKELIATQTFNP